MGDNLVPNGLSSITIEAEEEMTTDRLRGLDEMVAKLFRDDTPISTRVEPPLATSVDQPIIDEAVFDAGVIETAGDGRNETTMTDQPDSPLAGLSLDRAIHLRWVLRDIKAKRTKLSPVNPDDLRTLIEMGLIEMQNDEPVLTNEGHRALDWN
jgi:hypothetical protein